jgi:hypothetical protein
MLTLKTSLLSLVSVDVPVTQLKPAKNHSPYVSVEKTKVGHVQIWSHKNSLMRVNR